QTGSLHFREHAERFRDRAWRRRVQATNPQIDHIKGAEPEVCEVIINSFPELVRCERSRPISFRVSPRTDLGDDPQLLRIRMQCFFDQLIGDMRPIEVAGVDVIDSEPNDLAQDCDRAVVIFWWPEYMRTSELHGAVAHASQDQIIGKLDCAAGQGGGGHRFKLRNYELRIGRTKT